MANIEKNTANNVDTVSEVEDMSAEAMIGLVDAKDMDTEVYATVAALKDLTGYSTLTIKSRFEHAGLEPVARLASGNKGRPAFLFDKDLALDAVFGSGEDAVEVGTPDEQAAAEAIVASEAA